MEEHQKAIIGGQHTINKQQSALSLVRHAEKDHAYLILECIGDENQRLVFDIHLSPIVPKKDNPKKAEIFYRNLSNELLKIETIGKDCSSYTWNINREKVEQLNQLVQSEKARGDRNEINYIFLGKSQFSGALSSLQEDKKASLEKNSNNPSTDSLLRDGHNCGSWAIAMIRALDLQFLGSFINFVAVYPKYEITGTHKGEDEPSSSCTIF